MPRSPRPARPKRTDNAIAVHPQRPGQFVDSLGHRCYGRRGSRFERRLVAGGFRRRELEDGFRRPKAPMLSPRSISAAMLTAAISVAASAAPPRGINNLAFEKTFTEGQKTDIRTYAVTWSEKLRSEQPDDVDEARARLFEPLRAVQISQEFRFEYAKAALPGLDKAISAGTPHAAVNAIQIVALLGTQGAFDIIVSHVSADDEKVDDIRLWAAKSFSPAVRQGIIPENDVIKALRRLERAAEREGYWLALQRQFEAIASVDSPLSREIQVNVLRSITSRMQKQKGPSELMHAAYPALLLLRDKYISLPGTDQEVVVVGKSLAPVLHDLCMVAQGHWDLAQADAAARQSYGGVVTISENLLKVIDSQVRPARDAPRSEMSKGWSDRDKARFVIGNDQWGSVIKQPPYSPP